MSAVSDRPSDEPHGRGSFDTAAFVTLRFIALSYLFAFSSLSVQLPGLIGSRGIQPITEVAALIEKNLGSSGFFRLPSLFWFWNGDNTLTFGAVAGSAAAALWFFGVLPRLMSILCWMLYLSYVNADLLFFQYQWDNLLLEAGFLAILISQWRSFTRPEPSRLLVLLFHWLIFRLMFCSGVVKLSHDDDTWWSLTALNYHYLTQPLPTPLAYYTAKLPEQFHSATTFLTFAVELLLPCLFFLTRPIRHVAAGMTICFQVCILLTGNYAFFNFLTIGLCVMLFDDTALSRFGSAPSAAGRRDSAFHGAIFAIILCVGLLQSAGGIVGYRNLPAFANEITAATMPIRLVNGYGLFAMMTTVRNEIEIEGSIDGEEWKVYPLRYKPGRTNRPPPIIAPHQPRLDWQLWFAALGPPPRWFAKMLARMSVGSEPVLALFEENPFPEASPKYFRAVIYEYSFTSMEEKRVTGQWWKRRLIGYYFPPTEFTVEGTGAPTSAITSHNSTRSIDQ